MVRVMPMAAICEDYGYADVQHVGGIACDETVPSGIDDYCLNACRHDVRCPVHNPGLVGPTLPQALLAVSALIDIGVATNADDQA